MSAPLGERLTNQGLEIFIISRNAAILLEGSSRAKGKGQGLIILFEVVVYFTCEKSSRVTRLNRQIRALVKRFSAVL
jgi:hypothetical protein